MNNQEKAKRDDWRQDERMMAKMDTDQERTDGLMRMSLEEMKAHPGATPAWNQAKPKLNLTWKK
jgi:hypothetical protein